MLEHITPVILTANERPNITRAIRQLSWAHEVVIVDSLSSDGTVEIAREFSNARIVQRAFDSLTGQWTFAFESTGITTEWVLMLDADYVLSNDLIAEIATLHPPADVVAYGFAFTYAIFGRPLRGSLYPARPVLLRRGKFSLYQDGHTHRVRLQGRSLMLDSKIVHDDRKGLDRFLTRQHRYMTDEAGKLRSVRGGPLRDRIRRMRVVAPFVVFLQTLFVKGLIMDGWPGIYYALERTLAELILSMILIGHDLGLGGEGDR